MAKRKVKTTGKINKQKEMESKKRKKRKIVISLMIIVLLIGGISAYLLTSPKFAIQQILITGNHKLSNQQIIELAQTRVGDNLFSKFGIVMKVRLKQNGYIKDAEISKIYPNKIEINVTERTEQFQIKTEAEGYIYIDGQGYILKYAMDKLELPIIEGMSVTINDVGTLHRLNENDLNKMENVLQINEAFKKAEISNKITGIQVKDEYIIYLENDGITINLGNVTNLKDRMDYVKALLKQEAGNKGTIYVNGDLNEGFLPYFSAN